MTITQTVKIPADRRLIIDVPREIPAGQVVLTFTPKAEEQIPKKDRVPGCLKGQIWMADDFEAPFETEEQVTNKKRGFGCLKGQIWMADDFDAPLEDFKDYM